MLKSIYKRIVIKIGTAVLTDNEGKLDLPHVSHLVDQIAELKKNGVEVIVVSSGAVAAGKAKVSLPAKLTEVAKRQVYASVGNVRLMEIYSDYFSKYNLTCACLLVTKSDFRDRLHYINMKSCFEGVLQENIIPIVNENDAVSVQGIMFTDNDQLAGLIASMVYADSMVVLTHVDGLFTGHPKELSSKLISEVNLEDVEKLQQYISPKKSEFGRGGMLTKSNIAVKIAEMGISTHIINGKTKNILIDLLKGDKVGTKFIPKSCDVSSTKRWLADSEGHEKGVVYVNEGAEKALNSKVSVASLLPIGATKIEGHFEKGDIIKVMNEKAEDIGYGMANCNDEEARESLGQQDKKPIIKYDYLFMRI